MIKLEVAQSQKRLERFTTTIICNKLYVMKSWGICSSIRAFKTDRRAIVTIILAYRFGECVGCCMYVPKHEFTIQTFVKKTHRRKGIGKLMLKKLDKKHPSVNFTAETSSRQNSKFYSDLLTGGKCPSH